MRSHLQYGMDVEHDLPPPEIDGYADAQNSAADVLDVMGGMASPMGLSGLSMDSLRLPPHSIEAERCVLGCLLLDNKVYDTVSGVVGETDFYRSEHAWVFRAISQLIEKTRPADVITTFEWLQNAGRAEEVGGLPYINTLSQSVPSASNAKRYAEIVRERGVLRQLAQTAEGIAADCYGSAWAHG